MIMELFVGNDIEVRRQTWIEAIEASPLTKRLIRTQGAQIKRWDKMAQLFAKKKRPQGSGKAEANIIKRLQAKGALHSGARVLDIGAGLGNLTFRLAQVAESVTALEPSVAMARVLEDNALEKGMNNIHVERRRWQELDLDAEGLLSEFDLVVASMNPGVSGPDDLEKMNLASRGFCYLSRFSGLRGFYGFDGIWELFFYENPGMDPWDIIYPFNLLYAMGYRPALDFIVRDNSGRVKAEEAVQMISASLWNYMDETPEVQKTVEDFVMARSDKGLVKYDKGGCQGSMIWQADDKAGLARIRSFL